MKKAALLLLFACGHAERSPPGNGNDVYMNPQSGCVPGCDLTTDDGVNAALVKLGEKPQPNQGACIQHALDDRVALIGDFADDRGCVWRRAFVGCCLGPIEDQRILGALHWDTMSDADRAKLVPAYLAEIDGARALDTADPEFGKDGRPAFTPPTSVPNPDRSESYTAWFEGGDGGGMTRQTVRTFTKTEYTFDNDGKVSSEVLERFTVPVP